MLHPRGLDRHVAIKHRHEVRRQVAILYRLTSLDGLVDSHLNTGRNSEILIDGDGITSSCPCDMGRDPSTTLLRDGVVEELCHDEMTRERRLSASDAIEACEPAVAHIPCVISVRAFERGFDCDLPHTPTLPDVASLMGVMMNASCRKCGRTCSFRLGEPELCSKHLVPIPQPIQPETHILGASASFRDVPEDQLVGIPILCHIHHRWKNIETGELEAWTRYECKRCGRQKITTH